MKWQKAHESKNSSCDGFKNTAGAGCDVEDEMIVLDDTPAAAAPRDPTRCHSTQDEAP